MNQISVLATVSLLVFAFAMSTRAADRPNVVFIFADDMGYGEIEALNPERSRIPTPSLNRLAAEGVVFTDAHTSSSVCSPSRYALLTGRYNWRTRMQSGVLKGGSKPLIAADRTPLGKLFQSQGYRTAIFGKWHTIVEEIDVVDVLPRLTKEVVSYIDNHAADSKSSKPFFLYFPLSSPHSPIVPAAAWKGKGEKANLIKAHPKKGGTLLALLESYVKEGRSTPSERQANDAEIDIWKKALWQPQPRQESTPRKPAPQKPVLAKTGGAYDGTWESLQKMSVPAWFDDGKIGIFIHWGPYSVIGYRKGGRGYSEHVPKMLYEDPAHYYPYMKERWGSTPPDFGYKDGFGECLHKKGSNSCFGNSLHPAARFRGRISRMD